MIQRHRGRVDGLAVTTVHDPAIEARAVLACFPGGGMSSGYFDLALDGYSQAAHLAEQGIVSLLVDHPGVGDSDVPDDPWTLTPDEVARRDADVAHALRAEWPGLPVVGCGHSMGAMFVAMQQAAARPYDAVALLGHSGRGLPEVLTPDELAQERDLVDLAKERFVDPLPVGTTAVSEMLVGPDIDPEVADALLGCRSAMLACGGLWSMIPGSHTADLAAIDVPVFIGLADNDIAGPTHEAPGYLTGSTDVTLFVLDTAFHNHNAAPTRRRLWDRLAGWVLSQTGR